MSYQYDLADFKRYLNDKNQKYRVDGLSSGRTAYLCQSICLTKFSMNQIKSFQIMSTRLLRVQWCLVTKNHLKGECRFK